MQKKIKLDLGIIKPLLIVGTMSFMVSQAALASEADTCNKIDKALAAEYDAMWKYTIYAGDYNDTLFDTSYDNFYQVVASYITMADSLSCPLTLTQKAGVSVDNSKDGKFRTISWDELNGGTMHNFDGFIQYKGRYNTHVLTNTTSNVNSIETFVLPKKSGGTQTVYAVVESFIGSTRDHANSIRFYEVDEDKLLYPNIIKTASGTTNKISYSYDTRSLDETHSDKYPSIDIDVSKNSFSFPVVLASKKYPSGKVTNNLIKYKFKNGYFRKVAH